MNIDNITINLVQVIIMSVSSTLIFVTLIDNDQTPTGLLRRLKYSTFTYQSSVITSVLEFIQASNVEPGNLYIPMLWLIALLYYGWYITNIIHDIRRQTTCFTIGYIVSVIGTVLIAYLF